VSRGSKAEGAGPHESAARSPTHEPSTAGRDPERVDAARVRDILRAARLRARHSLSQNFLTDVGVLEAILAAAEPQPGEQILEIGPGLGILTESLLAAGAQVTAVELDFGLAGWLRSRFDADIRGSGASDAGASPGAAARPAGSLVLVEGDILDQDLATLVPPPFAVVANIPYHITSPILHRFLELERPPTRLVLMVQREVAERIAAPPGGMSYLSVFVQYHAHVRVAGIVPRTAFEPEPAVESAIVVVEPFARGVRAVGDHGPGSDAVAAADARLAGGALTATQQDDLWRLVQAAFRERRKMLHNVLARQLPMDPTRVRSALEAAGIDPERRPQTLSVEEWIGLMRALGPLTPDRRGRRDDPAAEADLAAGDGSADADDPAGDGSTDGADADRPADPADPPT